MKPEIKAKSALLVGAVGLLATGITGIVNTYNDLHNPTKRGLVVEKYMNMLNLFVPPDKASFIAEATDRCLDEKECEGMFPDVPLALLTGNIHQVRENWAKIATEKATAIEIDNAFDAFIKRQKFQQKYPFLTGISERRYSTYLEHAEKYKERYPEKAELVEALSLHSVSQFQAAEDIKDPVILSQLQNTLAMVDDPQLTPDKITKAVENKSIPNDIAQTLLATIYMPQVIPRAEIITRFYTGNQVNFNPTFNRNSFILFETHTTNIEFLKALLHLSSSSLNHRVQEQLTTLFQVNPQLTFNEIITIFYSKPLDVDISVRMHTTATDIQKAYNGKGRQITYLDAIGLAVPLLRSSDSAIHEAAEKYATYGLTLAQTETLIRIGIQLNNQDPNTIDKIPVLPDEKAFSQLIVWSQELGIPHKDLLDLIRPYSIPNTEAYRIQNIINQLATYIKKWKPLYPALSNRNMIIFYFSALGPQSRTHPTAKDIAKYIDQAMAARVGGMIRSQTDFSSLSVDELKNLYDSFQDNEIYYFTLDALSQAHPEFKRMVVDHRLVALIRPIKSSTIRITTEAFGKFSTIKPNQAIMPWLVNYIDFAGLIKPAYTYLNGQVVRLHADPLIYENNLSVLNEPMIIITQSGNMIVTTIDKLGNNSPSVMKALYDMKIQYAFTPSWAYDTDNTTRTKIHQDLIFASNVAFITRNNEVKLAHVSFTDYSNIDRFIADNNIKLIFVFDTDSPFQVTDSKNNRYSYGPVDTTKTLKLNVNISAELE